MSLAAQQKGGTEPQGLLPCQSLPAVHHDGAAEEIAESINPPSKFEEQVGVFRNPVIWPAGKLNVCHVSSSGFFFFLVKRWCILWDVFFQSKLKGIRMEKKRTCAIGSSCNYPQTFASDTLFCAFPISCPMRSHTSLTCPTQSTSDEQSQEEEGKRKLLRLSILWYQS